MDEYKRINEIAMNKFFIELEKAKKSKRQTKRVKDLLNVEEKIKKAVKDYLKIVWADKDGFELDNNLKMFARFNEKNFASIPKSYIISLYGVLSEGIGERKSPLDMRTSAEIEAKYYRCYGTEKEKEAIEKKLENITPMDSRFYKKFERIQSRIKDSFFIAKKFMLISDINTSVEAIDSYDYNHGDNIFTLNLTSNGYGKGPKKIYYDSHWNESWDMIPKGYEINSKFKVFLNVHNFTKITKSMAPDDRKLQTMRKKSQSILNQIKKLQTKKMG